MSLGCPLGAHITRDPRKPWPTLGRRLFPSLSLAIGSFLMTGDGTQNQNSPPPKGPMVSILRSGDVLAEESILIREGQVGRCLRRYL